MAKKASRLTAEELEALVGEPGEANADPNEVEVRKVEFADLSGPAGEGMGSGGPVKFLWDVPMAVEVVLGQTELSVRDVMDIGVGAVVELDTAYGEPVDIFLNGRRVARGEVVVVGEQFGVKITEILVSADEMEPPNPNP